jgi:menaquinone-dependent protoporphyrinogen oxidase
MKQEVTMVNHTLVFYGTQYGQTAKVARYIADCLTRYGVVAKLVNGEYAPRDLPLADCDGVIVGASVIRGRHQRCVRRFVSEHRDALNAMPSAFFSVSASAASLDSQGKKDAQRCIDEFLHDTGWRPAFTESVAGAMAFTKYNPFLRWMMKQISKRNGGPTDTSRDHEFTDWEQIERFTEVFVRRLLTGDGAVLDETVGV